MSDGGAPARHDVCNPVETCVGHHDGVERYPVAPVGRDHGGFWATDVIDPEELRNVVGWPRCSPPPLQIGGFIQPGGRMSVANSLQQHRHGRKIVTSNQRLFSK
jgi:hypothetical protein